MSVAIRRSSRRREKRASTFQVGDIVQVSESHPYSIIKVFFLTLSICGRLTVIEERTMDD